jgi:tetratricopeptide (TPR) repeat protein
MGQQGDFLQVLREQGYAVDNLPQPSNGNGLSDNYSDLPIGTTVFAIKYADGVLVAGDRRATAGNVVMYDRTDKVLEIDPKNVRAVYSKGVALFSTKKYAEARFCCQRAIELEPSNVKALCSMVWVLAHMKKYEDALPYCDKAIQIAPGYAYALSYKGKLLLELKKYEEALVCYNRALEIEPANQTAIYHKNKVLWQIEKKNKVSFLDKIRK